MAAPRRLLRQSQIVQARVQEALTATPGRPGATRAAEPAASPAGGGSSPGASADGTGAPHLLRGLHALLDGSDDAVFRDARVGGAGPRATIVYLDGMVEKEDVEERILAPILAAPAPPGSSPALPDILTERALTAGEVRQVTTLEDALREILSGNTLLFVEGAERAVVVANHSSRARAIEKPAIEFAVRGPRDSFSEILTWNVALVRRRLRDPALRVKRLRLGRRSQTESAYLYLDGVADPELVREVERRLRAIDVDGVLDSSYVEQLIEDAWWSPFPTVNGSERPDVVAANLLEGRVAVLVDNSSHALVVPATLDSLFHSPEDSYERWLPVNLLRFVRFLGSLLALFPPALYVTMASYHVGILPTRLALKVAASREGVAFPVLFEALLAQLMLELIKEAGFRYPAPVGQIFGVVGGLVLGELGVRAGIWSETMIITIAITAIASFSVPTVPLGTVIRLLGLPALLLAAAFGFYGVIVFFLLLLVHLCTLTSFGVPYLVPYAYFSAHDWKDTLFKLPLRFFRRRPTFFAPRDAVMQRSPVPNPPPGAA